MRELVDGWFYTDTFGVQMLVDALCNQLQTGWLVSWSRDFLPDDF
jgi:hypothetical protein